ncbi:MAG: hypothetical protein ABW196_07470 [Solirubrobacterales bacterium]
MRLNASSILPFAIAVVLPPAGLIIGLSQLQQNQELGVRLIVTSLLAAVVWVLLLV